MSKALALDTLHYANRLKGSGMPQKQAEVQAELFAEIIGDQLATKQDLTILKQDVELKIADLKNELIKWVLGVSVAQAAIIISCMKLIH